MDRVTAILGLTAVALTQNCSPEEAVQIATETLGDRPTISEGELVGLVSAVTDRAIDTYRVGLSI